MFTLLPTIGTFGFSLTNLTLQNVRNATFVGFDNYMRMFGDAQMWAALRVTIVFGLISLPIAIFVPILLALLMNSRRLAGASIFRTGFYFPYIIPFVAAVFVWAAILNPETGWINKALRAIGIENPPNWLNDPAWVYPALVIVGIWGIGNAFLISLAALQGVPTELYDAAKIDGAGAFSTFLECHVPDDFAGYLLQLDSYGGGSLPVLHGAAGA